MNTPLYELHNSRSLYQKLVPAAIQFVGKLLQMQIVFIEAYFPQIESVIQSVLFTGSAHNI